MNASRIERTLRAMERAGLEQILVSAPASVYYYTGIWVEPMERMLALHIRKNGDVRLYANRLFALGGADVPLTEFDDTDDCVAVLAQGVDAGRLGIDKIWHSQFTIRLMQARRDVTPVLGSAPVDEVRMRKDASELEEMRAASRMNDAATAAAIRALRVGMTEEDVAAAYRQAAKAEGSRGESFDSLICFGANCAEPHHATGGDRLREGNSVIIDVGCLNGYYCSDMTRTVFCGHVYDEQRRVYELVKAANAAGRAAARPGVPLKDIDRAARRVIEDGGYGKYFIHRTGHGIGLNVHEPPDVSASGEVIARPGMVF